MPRRSSLFRLAALSLTLALGAAAGMACLRESAAQSQASPPGQGKPRPAPGGQPVGAVPTTFPLQVTGGSGSGAYPASALVHIWADPAPEGSVFDRWTGELEPLIDRYAPHTTLVMPASRVAVRAVFKRAATCVPQTETLSGVEVTSCLPARHSAVVLLFHGGEGTGVSFFRNTEPRQLVADAAAAGFALIALDSSDREHKTWQIPAQGESPDLRNLRAVLDDFTRQKRIARGEPLYALGVAGGGNFAAHAARRLPCKAAALFFAPGNLPADYAVPTIWLMAQNQINRQPRALAEYTKLVQRQVPAKFDINDASPVYPLRFQRIRGVSPDESRAIHAFLHDQRYLDARDQLAQDPESSGWETALPERFAKLRGAIREQLDVCYGLARFYSDFDNRLLDFFNEHR
jgi:dienelactone hydrolase